MEAFGLSDLYRKLVDDPYNPIARTFDVERRLAKMAGRNGLVLISNFGIACWTSSEPNSSDDSSCQISISQCFEPGIERLYKGSRVRDLKLHRIHIGLLLPDIHL